VLGIGAAFRAKGQQQRLVAQEMVEYSGKKHRVVHLAAQFPRVEPAPGKKRPDSLWVASNEPEGGMGHFAGKTFL
jgi:hypothetical protein